MPDAKYPFFHTIFIKKFCFFLNQSELKESLFKIKTGKNWIFFTLSLTIKQMGAFLLVPEKGGAKCNENQRKIKHSY